MFSSLQKIRHSRLWIAIRLPRLPLTAVEIDNSLSEPIAVVEKQRVICVNEAARVAGIAYGMDVTTAQLISPSQCTFHARDRERERKLLKILADQFYQFSPHIEIYYSEVLPHAGLLVEVSTCLALFGGLKVLADRMAAHLREESQKFIFGLGHSSKGAWLLSFKRFEIVGDETKSIFHERLKALPVESIYDFPKEIDALKKTGFIVLGDIARQIDDQSLASIRKRFGKKLAQELSDIFSIEENFQQNSLFEKPVETYTPIEFFSHSQQFDYPISQISQLHYPIELFLQKLSEFLRKRQLTCQHIEWKMLDIQRNVELLAVHCDSAQSDWKLLFSLTLIQLEQKQLPFDVDTLELECRNTMPRQGESQLLAFDTNRKSADRSRSFAVTAAKIKARLGDGALFKVSYLDSLIPETSNIAIPLGETCNQKLPEKFRASLRPTWLFPTPIPIEKCLHGLYWRGYLLLSVGPERIQGNWWKLRTARDYYLAQRDDDVRLWVYHDLHKDEWYVQGMFR